MTNNAASMMLPAAGAINGLLVGGAAVPITVEMPVQPVTPVDAFVMVSAEKPRTTAEEVKHRVSIFGRAEGLKAKIKPAVTTNVTEREEILSKAAGTEACIVRDLKELGYAVRERRGDVARGRTQCEGNFLVVLMSDGSEELRITPVKRIRASKLVLNGEQVIGAGEIVYNSASNSIRYNGSGGEIETLGKSIFLHPSNIQTAVISGLQRVEEVFKQIFGREVYIYRY